jgi:hypothetical protein
VLEISDITFPMVVYSIPSNGFVPATLIADNGSALIASYMKNNGIHPLILDYNTPESIKLISEMGKEDFKDYVVERLVDIYRENDVRIAATKLYSNGFRDNMEIHRKVKERVPDLKIVAHGPHANWYSKEILDLYSDSIDIVSVGDGEVSAVPLVKWAYGKDGIELEDIPNINFRGKAKPPRKGYADMDTFPVPTYDEEFYLDIDDKIMMPMFDGSRGCPYAKCIFCAQPIFMGPYRERKTENVLRDVGYMKNTMSSNRSRLTDSSPKPQRVNDLLKHLPDDHKTSFFARSSTGYDFDLMKGKVTAIFIGLETAREDTLKLYRKTNDPKKYKKDFAELVSRCRDMSISTTASMIVPSPWETEKTMQENRDFILENNPDFCTALPIGVLSDTVLYSMIMRGEDVGILLDPDYRESMMNAELDLTNLNIRIPYKTMVNGKYVRNTIEDTMRFMAPLMEEGIFPAVDENVTMAEMYYGGLSKDQNERRNQVMGLSNKMRKYIENLDFVEIRKTIKTSEIMSNTSAESEINNLGDDHFYQN